MEATLLGIYYDERAAPHFGQNLNFFSLLKPQPGQNRNILAGCLIISRIYDSVGNAEKIKSGKHNRW